MLLSSLSRQENEGGEKALSSYKRKGSACERPSPPSPGQQKLSGERRKTVHTKEPPSPKGPPKSKSTEGRGRGGANQGGWGLEHTGIPPSFSLQGTHSQNARSHKTLGDRGCVCCCHALFVFSFHFVHIVVQGGDTYST